MERLFCLRYELPQPTANQKHDITSWTEAVDNSMAQLEHQAERFVYIEDFICPRVDMNFIFEWSTEI